MPKYKVFDEVPVWQEAARLYGRVLDVLEESSPPLTATFRNQLERAALSVSTSVAEGYETPKTGDLLALLANARGAAAEVQSMVAVVSARPKVARIRESLAQIRVSAEECARQLGAWRNAVEGPGLTRRASGDGSPSASGVGRTPAPEYPSGPGSGRTTATGAGERRG